VITNTDAPTMLEAREGHPPEFGNFSAIRLPAVAYSKRYSKILEYEYRVKTAALISLKRYFILSLTLYLE
jgi:hypothetical protein